MTTAVYATKHTQKTPTPASPPPLPPGTIVTKHRLLARQNPSRVTSVSAERIRTFDPYLSVYEDDFSRLRIGATHYRPEFFLLLTTAEQKNQLTSKNVSTKSNSDFSKKAFSKKKKKKQRRSNCQYHTAAQPYLLISADQSYPRK